jgi:hypothetical protein
MSSAMKMLDFNSQSTQVAPDGNQQHHTTYFAVNIALTCKTESSYTSPGISDLKDPKTI